MSITMETRRAAHESVDKVARRAEILSVWEGVMTGRDVLARLPYKEANAVLPRISEMTDDGILEPVEKRKSHITNRLVTSYRLTESGQAMKWRVMHGTTDSTEGQTLA